VRRQQAGRAPPGHNHIRDAAPAAGGGGRGGGILLVAAGTASIKCRSVADHDHHADHQQQASEALCPVR
jgi:hypothetical protein